jgi:heme O synthase-like polyprenyltransferase
MNKLMQFFGQNGTINPQDIGLKDPPTDANVVMGDVLTAVYFWAGVVAVVVIIIAGIIYTSSAGNPTNTKRAREAIIYSIVGLVVILMAFVITQFILGRF